MKYFFIFTYFFFIFNILINIAQAQTKPLTIIAMSDFHGALLPKTFSTQDNSKQTISQGGAALLSSYIKALKKSIQGPILIVDGGDLFQGSLISNIQEGVPVVEFYNALNVDAVAVGNHEFDFGPQGEQSTPQNENDDPQGALKHVVSLAQFPFLAVNIIDKKTNLPPSWLKKSIMKDFGGYKVGIIGQASIHTPQTTSKANLKGLKFIDPIKPIKQEALKLRAQGADYIILVAHEGGGCKDNHLNRLTDLSSCMESSLFNIIHQLPIGLIDLAAAGHTHQGVTKIVQKTAVLQSYARGRFFSVAKLTKSTKDHKTQFSLQEPISVCSHYYQTDKGAVIPGCSDKLQKFPGKYIKANFSNTDIYPDTEIETLLLPYLKEFETLINRPIGKTEVIGTFTRSYGVESSMTNMLVDYLKLYDSSIDLAFSNNSGIRDVLPIGQVTYGNLFRMLPFDNKIAIMELTGNEIKTILKRDPQKHGAISWSGLTYLSKKNGQLISAEVNGKNIEDNSIYRTVTNDYLARGGSDFDLLNIPKERIHISVDSLTLRDYLAKKLESIQPKLDPADFHNPLSPRHQIQ